MLSEYKGELQHCFWSKCYGYILLNLSPEKNLELIMFALIPKLFKQPQTLCSNIHIAWLNEVLTSNHTSFFFLLFFSLVFETRQERVLLMKKVNGLFTRKQQFMHDFNVSTSSIPIQFLSVCHSWSCLMKSIPKQVAHGNTLYCWTEYVSIVASSNILIVLY